MASRPRLALLAHFGVALALTFYWARFQLAALPHGSVGPDEYENLTRAVGIARGWGLPWRGNSIAGAPLHFSVLDQYLMAPPARFARDANDLLRLSVLPHALVGPAIYGGAAALGRPLLGLAAALVAAWIPDLHAATLGFPGGNYRTLAALLGLLTSTLWFGTRGRSRAWALTAVFCAVWAFCSHPMAAVALPAGAAGLHLSGYRPARRDRLALGLLALPIALYLVPALLALPTMMDRDDGYRTGPSGIVRQAGFFLESVRPFEQAGFPRSSLLTGAVLGGWVPALVSPRTRPVALAGALWLLGGAALFLAAGYAPEHRHVRWFFWSAQFVGLVGWCAALGPSTRLPGGRVLASLPGIAALALVLPHARAPSSWRPSEAEWEQLVRATLDEAPQGPFVLAPAWPPGASPHSAGHLLLDVRLALDDPDAGGSDEGPMVVVAGWGAGNAIPDPGVPIRRLPGRLGYEFGVFTLQDRGSFGPWAHAWCGDSEHLVGSPDAARVASLGHYAVLPEPCILPRPLGAAAR